MPPSLFLSSAPAEVGTAEILAQWLQTQGVEVHWSPADVQATTLCLVLLSAHWLRTDAAWASVQQAQQAGQPVWVLVSPDIPHQATDSLSRSRHAELALALSHHPAAGVLRGITWLWSCEAPGQPIDWQPLLNHLRQGTSPPPSPERTDQRHLQALCWGLQSRVAGLAALHTAPQQPDLALALAAAAANIADTCQARQALLACLGQSPGLQHILPLHPTGRPIGALAFSPDGTWLVSMDARPDPRDTRPTHLCLVHLDSLRTREVSPARASSLTALAWGRPWLALAGPGGIHWLRWNETDQRFTTLKPATLSESAVPRWLSWSGPHGPGGEDWLAWGSADGTLGLIRPETGRGSETRLRHAGQPDALQAMVWLSGQQLLTVERNEVFVRPMPALEPATSLAKLEQVFRLWTNNGHWLLSCQRQGRHGVLRGHFGQVKSFEAMPLEGAFEAIDFNLEVGEPLWLMCPLGSSDVSRRTSLTWGSRLGHRQTLLKPESGQPSALAVDVLRRRAATGDARTGQVMLWEPGARHPLLQPTWPAGAVSQCLTCESATVVWMDAQGDVHWSEADATHTRLNVQLEGFSAVRMLTLDNANALLLLGPRGDAVSIDQAGQLHETILWPAPLTPSTLGLVTTASEVARSATVDPEGMIRLLDGPPHAWEQVAEWHIPGQVLAVALSPYGDQIYALVAEGFIRVARWQAGGDGACPEWILVLRSNKPGPIQTDSQGGLWVADGVDVHYLPPPGLETPPLVLRGHPNTVLHIAASLDMVLCVTGRDAGQKEEILHLWSRTGQRLGTLDLPDKVATLLVSAEGRIAWIHTVTGAVWRVSLEITQWAQVAQAMAGRVLSPAERQHHGLTSSA